MLQNKNLDYSSFQCLVKSFLNAVISKERDQHITWSRWDVNNNKRKPTLEELGLEFGLSRERIRQIQKKGEKVLIKNTSVLDRFWSEVYDFTGPEHIVSSISDLSHFLSRKFNWAEHPTEQQIAALIAINPDFVILDDCENKYDKIKNKKVLIKKIKELISQYALYNAVKDEESDLWSIDFEEFRQLLGSLCRALLKDAGLRSVPVFILDIALKRTQRHLRKEGSRLYSKNLWALRFGNQIELVDTILLREARVMHASEVYQEVLKWRPKKRTSKHNIHAALDRSVKSILWGRGSFIHREHICLPQKLIQKIEEWLLKHLSNDVPIYCSHGLFRIFKKELEKSEIKSPVALYSCLRLSNHKNLSFPRYPYILLMNMTRIPFPYILEEYIQQAEGPVTYEDLSSFACNTLGLDETQFKLRLPDIPNIVRYGQASYLHTDWLNIDRTAFIELVKYTKCLVDRHHHVSISLVYENKQVTCLRLGINSPEMLFSLFELYASGEFDLTNFPQIFLVANRNEKISTAGISQTILRFLKDLARPCNYSELEDYFVLSRRYKSQNVYRIIQNECVFSYAHGCVVHSEVIGMTENKFSYIKESVYAAYKKSLLNDDIYVLTDDILEFYQLPALNNQIPWTPTLLADVLSKSNSFKVLGTARKVVVPIDNKDNIRTVQDLIKVIVYKEFSGRVSVTSLEEHLRARRVIKNRITDKMICTNSSMRIIEEEVVVEEEMPC